MTTIKVGRTTFVSSELKAIKLAEAYEKFESVNKEVVKIAWKIANPKK